MNKKIILRTTNFEFKILDDDYEYVKKFDDVVFHHYLKRSGHHIYSFFFNNLVFVTEFLTNKCWQVRLNPETHISSTSTFAVKFNDCFSFLSENPTCLSGYQALQAIRKTFTTPELKTERKKVIDVYIEKIIWYYSIAFPELFAIISDQESLKKNMSFFFRSYIEHNYNFNHLFDWYDGVELENIIEDDFYIEITDECEEEVKNRLQNVAEYEKNPSLFIESLYKKESLLASIKSNLRKSGCIDIDEEFLNSLMKTEYEPMLKSFDPFNDGNMESKNEMVDCICNRYIQDANQKLLSNNLEKVVYEWAKQNEKYDNPYLYRLFIEEIKKTIFLYCQSSHIISDSEVNNLITEQLAKYADEHDPILPFVNDDNEIVLDVGVEKEKLFNSYISGVCRIIPKSLEKECKLYKFVLNKYESFMFKKGSSTLKPWVNNVNPIIKYFINVRNILVKYKVVIKMGEEYIENKFSPNANLTNELLGLE